MEMMNWNRTLLLSSIVIMISGMMIVSGRSPLDRRYSIGVLAQGLVVLFVGAGAYHHRPELGLAAVVVLVLSLAWGSLIGEGSRSSLLNESLPHPTAASDSWVSANEDPTGSNAGQQVEP